MPTATEVLQQAERIVREKSEQFNSGQYEVTNGFIVKTGKTSAKIVKYEEEARSLAAMLNRMGFQPLAILPSAFWTKMCRKLGLYRFHQFDSAGRVETEWRHWADRLAIANAVAVGLATLVATVLILPLKLANPYGLLVVGCVLAMTLGIFAHKFTPRLMPYLLPHKLLLRLLFPNGESGSPHRYSIWLRVVFAPIDDTITKIFNNLSSSALYVAADARAVSFAKGELYKGYTDSVIREETDKEEARRARRLDPIIYLKQGKATAILHQFGEFPSEKKAMKYLRNMKSKEFFKLLG